MNKDFDAWNEEKKRINAARSQKLYKAGEVWWITFGMNIGHEQDGRAPSFNRPALIITAFNSETCLIVPLTTSPKRNRYYIAIGNIEGRKAAVNISQLRLIDTCRLNEKVCTLSRHQFSQIREKVRSMI